MHRIVVASLLLAVVVGVLTVAPRLVAWDRHREGLIRWVAAATDQAVTVDGPIDLHLLPRPTLSLAEITLVSLAGASTPTALKVERIDLRLAPLALLRGKLIVQEVRLVRPELNLDKLPIGVPGLAGLAGIGAMLPLAGEGPQRLSVIDGSAVMGGATSAATTLDAINFELSESTSGGPYEATGWLNAADQRLDFDARFGRIDGDDGSSLQLELMAAPLDALPIRMTFRGLAWWGQPLPRLRGEVSASGDDLRVGVAMLDRLLPHPLPIVSDVAKPSFELRGRLELDGRQVQVDGLELRLAETEARGRLTVSVAVPPRVDLELDVPRLALSDRPWAVALGSLPAALIRGSMTGRIDLVVGEIEYLGDRIRRLRTTLVLAEPGRVEVEGLRALLPGQTTASFDGSLVDGGSGTVLDGALRLGTDDLGRTLAWLGLRPRAAPGRLRTFSLATALSLDRDRLHLSKLDLRLDASHVSGSLGAKWSDRPQIAAALAVDRLNLDAYGTPAELSSWVPAALGRVDLALQTEIERLIWRGLRFETVRASGRSVDARFALDQLSFRSAETAGTLSGVVDLGAAEFELDIAAVTDQPGSLLRRLGIEGAPPSVSRLGHVILGGSARGRVDEFDLDLSFDNRETHLRVAGEAGWSDLGPGYRLELSASHPDHRAFFEDLGVRLAATEAEDGVPIDVQGTVRRTPGEEIVVAGTARLGPMSLTGRTIWRDADERPRMEVQLSAADVRAELLEAILAVAGGRRGLGALSGLEPGSWPRAALNLWRLDHFDATIDLSAKGGLAGDGLDLQAAAENGRLRLRKLTTAPFDGALELEAVLDVRRPLPFLAVALTLRAIESRELADWLGLDPVVEGRADLHMEVTSAGQSVADLIRGLIGSLELSVDDGRLVGLDLGSDGLGAASEPRSAATSLPFKRLGGKFDLHRGIARAAGVTLELNDGEGRIEGLVDLLSWAGDLELSWRAADGRDVALAVVGPLVRPQVVWRRPVVEVEEADPAPDP